MYSVQNKNTGNAEHGEVDAKSMADLDLGPIPNPI